LTDGFSPLFLRIFTGCRQGNPRSHRRSLAGGDEQSLGSGAPAGQQAEALLRALHGAGQDCAQAAGPAGGRKAQSDTASGDPAGAGQAAGRDLGVRAEVR